MARRPPGRAAYGPAAVGVLAASGPETGPETSRGWAPARETHAPAPRQNARRTAAAPPARAARRFRCGTC